MKCRWAALAWLILLAALSRTAGAAPAADVLENIHAYTLDNGLRVILVERHHAPVVHINLKFGVGGVDEPPGLGGIAHMAEHMGALGIAEYGSYDPEAERRALEELEDAVQALQEAERAAREGQDRSAEIEALRARVEELKAKADSLSEVYAFPRIFSAHGAVGYNAATSFDYTSYVVSLPKNRFELWARLMGDGLRSLIFRRFYSEVDVVKEERRYRNEDDPGGFLFERFLGAAFQVHPYGRPLIGSMDEISGYTARAAKAFWEAHYLPNNAVLAVAGDIDPDETLAVIERYFGGLAPGDVQRWEIPEEPPQQGERRITVEFDAEPQILIGYHKPTYPHRDAFVFDVIDAILSEGPTSRLVSRLVYQDRLALSVGTSPGYPALRYPNLFVFAAAPRLPYGTEDVERAFYEEIERLKTELVDERTLQKVRNQVRAGFAFSLESDAGLIDLLSSYELFLGGWQGIFDYPEIINSITAEEIRDVARRYFTDENRTVAVLLPKGGEVE